jgi:UDP-N-acetylmuramoyl-tripeptide--D-alanyl-D-alanine ligase
MTAAEIARVSRRLETGDLFVALPGARCDGHDFVGSALETAAAALVRRDADLDSPPPGRALVRVRDPMIAYHELARRERRERSWRVAAVTGSVGKTTTKDYLAFVLATGNRVGASGGNRNSTLGLPAEILSQDSGVEIFVAEAAMSSPGELMTLGEILRPQVLLYTRIAPVHTEFFPDLAGIVRAKAELLPWLDEDGTLVINADDSNQNSYPEETQARVIRYGAEGADARLEDLEDRGLLGSRFRLVLPGGDAVVDLQIPGRHQAENLLAAAAAASAFGVGAEQVAEAAPAIQAPEHRGRLLSIDDDISLVDDSYNASPVAVRRLLELLAKAPGRRVAVLGEMYELGDLAEQAHLHAGEQAASACDLLIAVGGADAERIAARAREQGLPEGLVHTVEDAEGATELLRRVLRPGDVVLIKGSRGVGLDRTVEALASEEAA